MTHFQDILIASTEEQQLSCPADKFSVIGNRNFSIPLLKMFRNLIFVLLQISFFIPLINSSKVRDRWGGSYPSNDGCIIHLMEMAPGIFDQIIHNLYKQLVGFREANCTQRVGPLIPPGYETSDGSYTGILGMIQRSEITTSLYSMCIDDIPPGIGTIGFPLVSTTGIVVMAENNRTQIPVNFISIFANFDILTYAYVLILTLVCSIFLSLLTCKIIQVDNSVFLNLMDAFRNISKVFFTFLSSCVCQYNFGALRFAPRFIWLGFLLSTTFLFYHFGRNLISSDLVAVKQDPHPESITELLSPKYERLEIKVMQALQLVAKINKTEGPLKERIFRKKSNLITGNNLNDMEDVIESVAKKESVVLIEEFPYTNFKPHLCSRTPDFGKRSHVSKAKVFPCHAYSIISRGTRDKLLRFLLYRFQTTVETGTYTNYVKREAPFETLTQLGQKIDWKLIKCLDSYKDKAGPVSKDYTLKDVASFFLICFLLTLIATVILILELITPTSLFTQKSSPEIKPRVVTVSSYKREPTRKI